MRGERVPLVKIERYRKRNPLELRVEVARARSLTPPGVEVYTPLASPVTMPRVLRLSEELLKCVQDYISGAFDSKLWISDNLLNPIQSQQQRRIGEAFFNKLYLAYSYFMTGHSEDGEIILLCAKKRLGDVIRGQYHRTVISICHFICILANSGNFDRLIPIIAEASAVASRIYHPKHPTALLWSLIHSYLYEAESNAILPAIRVAWKSAVDSFEYALSPLHTTAIENRSLYISVVEALCDRQKSLSDLDKLLHRCTTDSQGPGETHAL